ncbi:MAG: prepilin-type N-terminal cleavage/methylation domain-containing protein [Nitrospira sp.]
MHKNISKKIIERFSRGFTLVESMVAISILSIVIAGTFTAVVNGLQSSSYAKDQITAFWLAQEGMEFIKNVRDENALHSLAGGTNTWLTGLSAVTTDPCWFGGSGTAQKTCTIDSNIGVVNGVATCAGGFGTCPVIREDPATGLMGYNGGWNATSFRREIQFQSISATEVAVTIRMSWTNRARSRSFQITETLFNRQ